MALNLRGEDLRAAFAKLRAAIVEGLDHNQVCERLGLSWGDVDELKRKFYDEEAELVRHKPTEHAYVEYCLEMRRCMEDLDRVIEDYEKQKNVSGYVGAVRARADIVDRMLKTGQELGLVERMASEKGYAAGQAIKDMGNKEFRQFIHNEMHVFNQILVKYGDRPMLEIDPGALYAPAPSAKFPVQKTKGHARSKVFAGRRVVREE